MNFRNGRNKSIKYMLRENSAKFLRDKIRTSQLRRDTTSDPKNLSKLVERALKDNEKDIHGWKTASHCLLFTFCLDLTFQGSSPISFHIHLCSSASFYCVLQKDGAYSLNMNQLAIYKCRMVNKFIKVS